MWGCSYISCGNSGIISANFSRIGNSNGQLQIVNGASNGAFNQTTGANDCALVYHGGDGNTGTGLNICSWKSFGADGMRITPAGVSITGTLGVSSSTNIGGALTVSNTTASTSGTTGALVVLGGVGVGGSVFASGLLRSNTGITSTGNWNMVGAGTANLNNVNVNGNATLFSSKLIDFPIDSISLSTAAVVVTGGLSIGMNLRVGASGFATAFTNSSDYRLKSNITDLSGESVLSLRPVSYEINGDAAYGFIAHEVQEVHPRLVTGVKDDEGHQSLNYIGLIPLIVKDLQKLRSDIDI